MYFRGKSVWITGASSGIGEALARELSRRGARLLLSARRVDRLERLKAECSQGGASVTVLPFDQEKIDEAEGVVHEARAALGRVDVLVNNAGLGQSALALDTTLAVTERIFRVNTLGVIALTRAILPSMLAQGGGHLVATSSVLGKYGVQRRSSYSASKHALHGYFDSLRCELEGTKIKITLVCPGWVHTELERLAMKGDGSLRGQTDAGKDGLTPEAFAPKMLAAIESGKREAYIGRTEASAVWLHRFAPNLLTRILAKQPVD